MEGGDLFSSSSSCTETSELGGWGLGMRLLILGSTQNWWGGLSVGLQDERLLGYTRLLPYCGAIYCVWILPQSQSGRSIARILSP